VGDVPADEVRRMVEELGGCLRREQLHSSGLRAGRPPRSQAVEWLEVPESAFGHV
jgi:hypothetical protein